MVSLHAGGESARKGPRPTQKVEGVNGGKCGSLSHGKDARGGGYEFRCDLAVWQALSFRQRRAILQHKGVGVKVFIEPCAATWTPTTSQQVCPPKENTDAGPSRITATQRRRRRRKFARWKKEGKTDKWTAAYPTSADDEGVSVSRSGQSEAWYERPSRRLTIAWLKRLVSQISATKVEKPPEEGLEKKSEETLVNVADQEVQFDNSDESEDSGWPWESEESEESDASWDVESFASETPSITTAVNKPSRRSMWTERRWTKATASSRARQVRKSWPEGTFVRIVGLVKKTHLNGRLGRVSSTPSRSADRVAIMLPNKMGHIHVHVKRENIVRSAANDKWESEWKQVWQELHMEKPNLARITEDEAIGGTPLHMYRGTPLKWTEAEKEFWTDKQEDWLKKLWLTYGLHKLGLPVEISLGLTTVAQDPTGRKKFKIWTEMGREHDGGEYPSPRGHHH